MRRIKLLSAVATIYKAVEALESQYPERMFMPDGHS